MKLKFRVWDNVEKVMWYPENIKENRFVITQGGKLYCLQYHLFIEEPERYIPTFYAGYQDINGKDVYELDIVELKVTDGSMGYDYDKDIEAEKRGEIYNIRDYLIDKSVVIFENGKFSPSPERAGFNDSYYDYKYYDFKIVGNIFEDYGLDFHLLEREFGKWLVDYIRTIIDRNIK
jgi:hypothetical protein